jgi:hypothetical protein
MVYIERSLITSRSNGFKLIIIIQSKQTLWSLEKITEAFTLEILMHGYQPQEIVLSYETIESETISCFPKTEHNVCDCVYLTSTSNESIYRYLVGTYTGM